MILSALGSALLVVAAPTVAMTPPAVPIAPPSGMVTLPSGALIAVQTIAPPLPPPDPSSSSESTVIVSATRTKGDPYENFNRKMFNAHQKFDKAVLRPAALGYKHIVPKPIRSGLRNFFSNLTEPIVFLNDLLQLKPGRAVATFGRFVFNSTLGFGGLLDIAKLPGLHLPHRPNGFGDTLGFYGVKPGPYLFLPFVGPTDLRDLLGGQADGLVLPLAIGKPFDRIEYQIPKAVITGLDQRAESDDDLTALFAGAVDPYATLRSVYLQDRAGEIAQLHGRANVASGPTDELDDPLADPAAAPPAGRSAAPELSDPLTDSAATPSTAPELDDPLTDPARPAPAVKPN